MGGYAVYVWGSYGFAMIVLDLLVAKTVLDWMRMKKGI